MINKPIFLLCIFFSVLFVSPAWALPVEPSEGYPYDQSVNDDYRTDTVHAENVTLDYIYKSTYRDYSTGVIYYDDTDNLLKTAPENASAVAGVYVGNDDGKGQFSPNVSDPNPNIGQYEDGLLNGEKVKYGSEYIRVLNGMEFIDQSDLQDLDNQGYANDPGWIHLANYQQDTGSVTYDTFASDPDNPRTLNFSELLTFTIDWTTPYVSGNWQLAIDPVVMAILILDPESEMFDQIVLSLKSANSFALYDFNFPEIFGKAGNEALGYETAYTLGGTFNTNDLVNDNGVSQDISHINIWARDPESFSSVPEPATILLFAIGFLGVAAVSRKER